MTTEVISLPYASQIMTQVQVDREEGKLLVLFGDGTWVGLSAEQIEAARPRPTKLDLSRVMLDDPHVLVIGNAQGGTEELPWDLVRYLGDPEFARSEREKGELSKRVLGERIKKLRERAALTQEELAQKAKVGRATISRLENGKEYANTRTLRSIAKALGLNLADLILAEGSDQLAP